MGLGAQFCEHTRTHWIVHIEQVNFPECKLYLNKAVFKGDLKLGFLKLPAWQLAYALQTRVPLPSDGPQDVKWNEKLKVVEPTTHIG